MKVCKNCNGPILGSGKVFCSLSCSSSFNGRNREKLVRLSNCKFCGSEFIQNDLRKKFCDHSCAAKSSNLSRKKDKQRNCDYCDKVFIKTSNKVLNSCSHGCAKKQKIKLWLSGELSACGVYSLFGWARQYVLEQAGYQCEAIDSRTGLRCTENRLNIKTNKTVLQVDHIDGNWQNCQRENLRAICPTCHCLTDTWGAANMGNGRTWKKEYKQYSSKVSGEYLGKS